MWKKGKIAQYHEIANKIAQHFTIPALNSDP